jgi:hypothetical protein
MARYLLLPDFDTIIERRLLIMIARIGLAAASVLLLTLGTAHADPYTYAGYTTLSDNTTGNPLDVTSPTTSFSESLSFNSTTTVESLFTITSSIPYTEAGTYTDSIAVTFTFTQPSGSTTVSGTDEATLTFTGSGDAMNVEIIWSDPVYFTFADGSTLELTLSNVGGDPETDQVTVPINVSFTLMADPVPEPFMLGLLGTGLLGLGFTSKRHAGAR